MRKIEIYFEKNNLKFCSITLTYQGQPMEGHDVYDVDSTQYKIRKLPGGGGGQKIMWDKFKSRLVLNANVKVSLFH